MRRATSLLTVLAVLALAAPATAAAPNYILVSGPRLAHPVLMADWNENLALLSSLVDAPKARRGVVRGLAQRPRLRLAEFWGWGDRPRPTRPSQANQHGWFYPAHQRQPAIVNVMVGGAMVPRLAPAAALRIFVRHRIPIRL